MSKRGGVFLSLYNTGWSYQRIADEFGVTKNAVAGAIYKARHPYQPKGRVITIGNKLTAAQAEDIRQRVNVEKSIALAAEFGVSEAMISHIAKGRRWHKPPYPQVDVFLWEASIVAPGTMTEAGTMPA
jgi:hypothetical protein